ncbi:hypothetical protein M0Q97_04850 [Candidatus Dojkabacteria bacterium]|jgi:hypothetical protein|nr:hypothetical protein [Candidatus Dojkabacteria bacterium]
MNLIVDNQKAIAKWKPVLESLGVDDPYRMKWMAEYAEMHSLNENVAYSTLGNLNGMGAIQAAQPSATPGLVWGDYGAGTPGGIGSGDIGQNLLPVSMKIAAQTIGLDLVAVKPASSPKVDMLFVDFKYDNLADSTLKDERPIMFQMNCTNASTLNTALKAAMATKLDANAQPVREKIGGLTNPIFVHLTGGTITVNVGNTTGNLAAYFALSEPITAAGIQGFDPTLTNYPANGTSPKKEGWLEFLGWSRINGYPMFRVFRQFNTGANNAGFGFVDDRNTFPTAAYPIVDMLNDSVSMQIATTASVVTEVSLTGATIQLVSLLEDHIPGFSAGWYMNKPMTRDEDERTYPNVIGPDIFTKTIQVGDVEISSSLKRTQIEDIKAATGMDIVQKLESVLVNELTQTISKQIVAKVTELADKNRTAWTTPKDGAGLPKFDLNIDTYLAVGAATPGGETTHSIQRKLIAKINNASNFIATEGRVGPAQYLVTNGNLASVIQDVAGYTLNPVKANLNANGQLFPMGNVGNISIYVDPYQRWDDNRIFLGRKNSVDQPGLVFVPYLMAQSIQLISEATWAPRMLIRSRYAVADIGFFPWKQFMTIVVTDSAGVLI